jgi:hypothetical protein
MSLPLGMFAQQRHCVHKEFVPELATQNESLIYRSTKVIPVVIHIVSNQHVHVSNLQVYAQIAALNRDFNREGEEWRRLPSALQELATDANITFELAKHDPDGKPTIGINQKVTSRNNIGLYDDIFYQDKGGIDAWDTQRYLNIWVAEMPEGLLGYASSPEDVGTPTDGVVINIDYFGTSRAEASYQLGRTLVHEVGHYLGLSHPWGSIQQECEEDDGLEDTHALAAPHYECPPFEDNTCDTMPFYWNFMDYTPDCCMALFTHQQVLLMHHVLEQYRPLLRVSSIRYEEDTTEYLMLTPNPAISAVLISWAKEVNLIEFYTISGRRIDFFRATSNERYKNLCLDHYPKGVLIVVFHTENGEKNTKRLIHL